MIFTLLGAPGSGKGTQGRLLAQALGLPLLSSGDVLRRAIGQQTPTGLRVQPYVEQGLLVPDDLLVPVVSAVLSSVEESQVAGAAPGAACGVILDGFPRTRAQAEALDALRAERGGVAAALLLRVTDKVVLARLAGRLFCAGCEATYHVQSKPPRQEGICDACGTALSQRADDTPETVRRRLTVYAGTAQPLEAYYRERGRLVEVDGDQPAAAVSEQLVAAVRRVQGLSQLATAAEPWLQGQPAAHRAVA